MRKPIVALGLCLTTGLTAMPVAEVLAATPTGSTLSFTPPSSSLSSTSSTSLATRGVSGAAIIQTAMKYLGYPYTATGNSPATGFSCIGFVSYVYRQNGIPLPGDLQDAYAYAPKIAFSNLEPGDVLFFQNTVWTGLSHAAIYLGGGRFIHSEWYGEGVKISSFTNDPVDYNYWTQHYLGASRPWTGATSNTVAVVPTVASTKSVVPTPTPQPRLASGPRAVITVRSLNVRSGPGMKQGVQAVTSKGTSVVILGHSHGWYKVQLPNGTVGWIVGAGIGRSTVASGPGRAVSKHADPTVGNPTAPARQKAPVSASRLTARVEADGLRVHRGPRTAADVVTTLPRGQHLEVLRHSGNWDEVRLPDGTVGWVSASYVSSTASSRASHPLTIRRTSITHDAHARVTHTRSTRRMPQRSSLKTAVNVHSGPGMSNAVLAVIPPGGGYAVIGSRRGWIHVRLADGETGWVKGSILGSAAANQAVTQDEILPDGSSAVAGSTPSAHYRSSGRHVLTAGVRIHTAPGVKSPVIGLVAAGTAVRVLNRYSNWDHVRIPDGTAGYVDATYVR